MSYRGFELPGVDCVYSRGRIETKCTFVMQVFEIKKNAKFAKVDARFPRIFSLHNRTTDTENKTNVIGLLLSCSVRDPRLTSIFSGLCKKHLFKRK